MESTLHPEKIDPPWFQELSRRAFEREMRRLMSEGIAGDAAIDEAMWYVFEIRDNLTELYKAGKAGQDG